jgi:hypothetical protein
MDDNHLMQMALITGIFVIANAIGKRYAEKPQRQIYISESSEKEQISEKEQVKNKRLANVIIINNVVLIALVLVGLEEIMTLFAFTMYLVFISIVFIS